MNDSDTLEGGKRGRPATGRAPVLKTCVRPDLMDRVTRHAAKEFLSVREAVEQLLEWGLDAEG